jgi:hypothetical protein
MKTSEYTITVSVNYLLIKLFMFHGYQYLPKELCMYVMMDTLYENIVWTNKP